ncbi:MAG TPA: hypothetical protein H9687_04780 [Firmicutes bacterium]|nr:hypothetical protein [Bacillota bacterium]
MTKLRILQKGVLFGGLTCLLAGLWRGEGAIVLTKAVRICLECIGIG